MPRKAYKKTKRPAYRPRKNVRRRRNYSSKIPRSVTVWSNIPQLQRHRYCDYVALTTSGALPVEYVFRLNSMFDPDYTGTGHQPMRFDQMCAFYSQYCVVGAKVTIKYLGYKNTNTDSDPFIANFTQHDGTSLGTNWQDRQENGKGKSILINSSLPDRKTITQYYSMKKIFNVKNMKDNFDRLGAPFSTNPSQIAYGILSVDPLSTTGATSYSFQFMVTIDFLTLWSNPPNLTQS